MRYTLQNKKIKSVYKEQKQIYNGYLMRQ